ncbi:MAG: putative Ig domain-containing protein [Gemmatimonadaceae bacterium]
MTACGGAASPDAAPLVILTSPALPDAVTGQAYHQELTASGGDGRVVWRVSGGQLPDSLALTPDGILSGMPRARGDYQFTVSASSLSRTASADMSMHVALAPLTIVTSALPVATVGSSYSELLTASGGEGTTTWSVAGGSLPLGLSLGASGLLVGSPQADGQYAFAVHVVRGDQSADRPLALTVNPQPLVILTAELPLAKVGVPYIVSLESSGGSTTPSWSLADGRLPGGLSLSASGVVSGTPAVAESTSFTVRATSGVQDVSRVLALWVDPAGFPSSATVTMPGNIYVPFVVQIQRGGTVTWRFESEPHNVIFQQAVGAPPDINIVSNVDVARRFDTVGVFRYDCTIHPGMSGRVDVKP